MDAAKALACAATPPWMEFDATVAPLTPRRRQQFSNLLTDSRGYGYTYNRRNRLSQATMFVCRLRRRAARSSGITPTTAKLRAFARGGHGATRDPHACLPGRDHARHPRPVGRHAGGVQANCHRRDGGWRRAPSAKPTSKTAGPRGRDTCLPTAGPANTSTCTRRRSRRPSMRARGSTGRPSAKPIKQTGGHQRRQHGDAGNGHGAPRGQAPGQASIISIGRASPKPTNWNADDRQHEGARSDRWSAAKA